MSVPAAYIGVVLIWTTTPLAVKWSTEGVGFLFGVSSRMTLAVIITVTLSMVLGKGLPWHRAARRTYVAAGLGMYSAMLSLYWGAQFIPSGWISVIFGTSPIITSVLAAFLLGERSLNANRLGGLIIGLGGLCLIFANGLGNGLQSFYGALAVLLAALCYSASLVWVKRINAHIDTLAMVAGSLLIAVPLYLLTWIVIDGAWPALIPNRTGVAIIYLGVIGSVIGFMLFYYVLRHMEATRTALITLITPVTSLSLGHLLNSEPLTSQIIGGTALVITGLLIHEYSHTVTKVFN